MKTATKKLGVLLFVMAGLAPLLFVLFFSFKQQLIRHRMHRRLEEQQLHSIVLSDDNVHWIRKDKEVLVDGKLFDVEEIESANGITTLHGLFDEEETQLKKLFNNEWDKSLASQNQLLAKIFQCLNGFYCNSLPNFNDLLSRSAIDHSYPPGQLPTWIRPILTPPPQAWLQS